MESSEYNRLRHVLDGDEESSARRSSFLKREAPSDGWEDIELVEELGLDRDIFTRGSPDDSLCHAFHEGVARRLHPKGTPATKS